MKKWNAQQIGLAVHELNGFCSFMISVAFNCGDSFYMILAIESSTILASVAVLENDKILPLHPQPISEVIEF